MRANLRNQARQTHLPRWKPLLPIFEAVINSFQAIYDAPQSAAHKITISIDRDADLLGNSQSPINSFVIKDTGIGFNDDNFDSFNTLFSEHKLKQGGKGVGRTMWLKAFDRIEIDSTFIAPESGQPLRRSFIFDENYDPENAAIPQSGATRGTEIRLLGFRDPYKSECQWTTEQIVQRLIEHFLLILLQPKCPRVEVHDNGFVTSINDVFDKEFKANAKEHLFKINGIDFSLHGFRLFTQRTSKHRLIYAANQRGVVQDNLDDYVPNLTGAKLPNDDGRSFYYLAIVQSPYLTEKVNPARTDFDLAPDDAEAAAMLLSDEISRAEIRDNCIERIENDLSGIIELINEAKAERIRSYVNAEAPQYKILLKYLSEFINTISAAPTKSEIETALHRELHQREVRLRQESSKIIREAEKVSDYDDYNRRLSEFMKNYNEVGMSQLANYVSHRKVILEFLERAITRSPKDNKYPLERVVHQLVFPRRSTSEEIAYQDHNLWLIDERLTYHSLITSDKALSSVTGLDVESEKRPDLFIFDRRVIFAEDDPPLKSIVLVEFKKPQRDDYTMNDNPVVQCLDMITEIREGSFLMENGRPIPLAGKEIPAFCYIVCDITKSLTQVLRTLDAQRMPDGNGYFNFHKDSRAYYEVIDYDKLLADGKKRNRIFFDKLNIASQH